MQVELTKRIFLMVESRIEGEGWGLVARTAQLHPHMIGAACTSLDGKMRLERIDEGERGVDDGV